MSFTRIPEIVVEGKPLGRHIYRPEGFEARLIEHDETVTIADVEWKRHTAPFDQGQIGSCTGNAAAGCLDTDPLYVPGRDLGEPDALAIYTKGSAISSPGDSYPPNDVGSSGPASAQACEELGYISSYTHAIDLQTALQGLQSVSGSFGVSWYDSFDNPLPTGECPLTPTAQVRGGHEIEVFKVDTENKRVWFYNSWGPTWGGVGNGTAWFSYDTLTKLFADQADATFFVQATNPVPNPTPSPVPAPVATSKNIFCRFARWLVS